MKELTEKDYEDIAKKYDQIIDMPNREQKIDELAEQVERDLFLLGCTGIEDRLQDNVSETIQDLLKANIKVWMLTGDKLETAENIAKSCSLFKSETQVLTLNKCKLDLLEEQFEQVLKAAEAHKQAAKVIGMIVDGEALALIFSS